MIIKLSSSAHKDLKNIYEFLKLSSKKSAKKEIQLIYDAIDNLLYFPYIGKKYCSLIKLNKDYRTIIVRKYIIFYVVEKDEIKIYRVFSSNEDYIKKIL